MNQKQQAYLVKRINEIEQNHLKTLRLKYTTKAVNIPSIEMKLKLLKEGKFNILPKNKRPQYGGLDNFLVFEGEVKAHFDKEGYDKKVNEIKTKATELKDQIILGDDAQEALKMLKDFEDMV